MRIDLVCMHSAPFHVPDLGDPRTDARLLGLATGLADAGHDVLVRTRRDDPQCPAHLRYGPHIQVEYLPAGPPRPLSPEDAARYSGEFAAGLAHRWARTPPRLIHASDWASGLAAQRARQKPAGVVVQGFRHLHAAPRATNTAWRARLRLQVALGSSADAVIVESTEHAEQLGRLGVARRAVRTIPPGVDLDVFHPEPGARRHTGPPRVVHVCRRLADADLDTVIRALPAIPGVELVIVGGPPRDRLMSDTTVRALNSLAASLGVADRVRYTGMVSRTTVAHLLRSSDVALNMPKVPGFGTAVVEAMACGVPVIATAHGGRADSLLDGTTGYYVRPGRPYELARRVVAMLRDDVLLEATGIAAVDRARSRYSWRRIVEETLAVYEHAAGARAGVSTSFGRAAAR